jgi:hypothetical protein
MGNVAAVAEFARYDPTVFRRLSDFHLARDELEQYRESVAELGDMICVYGLHECVAVSLLHKHFEISDEEVVVREFVDNVSYMTPWNIRQLSSALPYLWKAAITDAGVVYHPLEFCDYPDRLEVDARHGLEALSGSSAFLTAFASRLAGLGLIDVFGLASLRSRDGLTMEPGETLLETTDEDRRILTLRPVPTSELHGLDTTQTLWVFRPVPWRVGAVVAGATCAVHCAGHCLAHSTRYQSVGALGINRPTP